MIEEILIEMLYDEKLIDRDERSKALEFIRKYNKAIITKTYTYSVKETNA